MQVGPHVWVCLAPGVHEWAPGVAVDIRIDTGKLFVFDKAGKIVTSPAMMKTAEG